MTYEIGGYKNQFMTKPRGERVKDALGGAYRKVRSYTGPFPLLVAATGAGVAFGAGFLYGGGKEMINEIAHAIQTSGMDFQVLSAFSNSYNAAIEAGKNLAPIGAAVGLVGANKVKGFVGGMFKKRR